MRVCNRLRWHAASRVRAGRRPDAYRRIRQIEAERRLDDLEPGAALRKLVGFTFDYQLANPEFIRLVMTENIHNGEFLDPAKIFLVQLADFMWNEIPSVEERINTARHFRVFPGEGVHSEQLAELVMRLDRLGYRGDYSFEVSLPGRMRLRR